VKDQRPLRRKANLGHRGDGPSDRDARQPGVEQADPLNIGARQERAEGAAEHIGCGEKQHEFDARRVQPRGGLGNIAAEPLSGARVGA
jgi:hypothetical protein